MSKSTLNDTVVIDEFGLHVVNPSNGDEALRVEAVQGGTTIKGPLLIQDNLQANGIVAEGAILAGDSITAEAELNARAGLFDSNGKRVVTDRQPAIPDLPATATLADLIASQNAVLAMLRAHGLIET